MANGILFCFANRSQAKKAWAAFLINAYTFVVYASSSIYISSQLLIMERFGVGHFKAALGLALYVLGEWRSTKMEYHSSLTSSTTGYGIGPLLFAPMSESTCRFSPLSTFGLCSTNVSDV